MHERSDNAVELDCPIKIPHRYWFGDLFVGCCDGLVCIAIEREVCIWNPSTRKSKSLPSDGTSCHYLARYGFGYDDTIDDYKVVGFFGDVSKGRYEVEVKVYTLRSDSWKKIGGFPHNLSTLNGLGTFVNGALHWIVTMKSNMIIVSLDLAKETFAEVLQPDYRDGHWYETLFVLNGCLGMLCGNNACADIWVMEQYGIRESWTNLVVIPRVPYLSGYPYSPPLCILKNGEILLKNDVHLVRYNPKDGTFSYPMIHNCSPCFCANSYVESLVLPCMDADSGVQLQHRY
ncbi:hypothetical protein RHGRI_014903 [Rhododendron griersonianum]|uniref:F-box associated beta-propeller type 3 domain-containing protein n=1 Tax=Rhododendron griersonianum TaxID=479676 RepID=A0AAV6KBT9_9ERIC|nr:hypothetical protein RHGRI_014903 [Rhododendron griersonianum]